MTQIRTTIRPDLLLDVGDAELESLLRQGLVVGQPAPVHVTVQDTVVAQIHTTIRPDVQIGVGAAELESLTRQGLVVGQPAPVHVFVPDTVVARVRTTITPAAYLAVGAAELESLTRQHLVAAVFYPPFTDCAAAPATGSGAANDATVGTDGNGSVAAGKATGTGVAPAPTVKLAVPAGVASGVGAANGATTSTAASTSAAAGNAVGTGAAPAPAVWISPAAGAAAGTGAARTPTVQTSSAGQATAGRADGTGAAQAPSVRVDAAPAAGNAAGTGSAFGATVSTPGGSQPDDITGLEVWYKADTLALSDGAAITAWPDSGSNAYDAEQPVSGHEPIYKTGIINGLPVARFSAATGTAVRSSAPTSADNQTLFAVLKPTSTALSGTASIRNSDTGALLLRLNGGKVELVRAGVTIIGTGATTLTADIFVIICATFSTATSWQIFINGSSDASGSTSVTLSAGGVTAGLGADGIFGGNPFDGDIAEWITYDSVLSSGDRGTVESYLSGRYGI